MFSSPANAAVITKVCVLLGFSALDAKNVNTECVQSHGLLRAPPPCFTHMSRDVAGPFLEASLQRRGLSQQGVVARTALLRHMEPVTYLGLVVAPLPIQFDYRLAGVIEAFHDSLDPEFNERAASSREAEDSQAPQREPTSASKAGIGTVLLSSAPLAAGESSWTLRRRERPPPEGEASPKSNGRAN